MNNECECKSWNRFARNFERETGQNFQMRLIVRSSFLRSKQYARSLYVSLNEQTASALNALPMAQLTTDQRLEQGRRFWRKNLFTLLILVVILTETVNDRFSKYILKINFHLKSDYTCIFSHYILGCLESSCRFWRKIETQKILISFIKFKSFAARTFRTTNNMCFLIRFLPR